MDLVLEAVKKILAFAEQQGGRVNRIEVEWRGRDAEMRVLGFTGHLEPSPLVQSTVVVEHDVPHSEAH